MSFTYSFRRSSKICQSPPKLFSFVWTPTGSLWWQQFFHSCLHNSTEWPKLGYYNPIILNGTAYSGMSPIIMFTGAFSGVGTYQMYTSIMTILH
jgi:hypothetical protein